MIHNHDRARLYFCRAALLCLNRFDSEPIKCSYLNFDFLTESYGELPRVNTVLSYHLPIGDTYNKQAGGS